MGGRGHGIMNHVHPEVGHGLVEGGAAIARSAAVDMQ